MTTAQRVHPLEAAARHSRLIRDNADRAEHDREIAPEVIQVLRNDGLFDLLLPASLGGQEVDPFTFVSTIEAVSRDDGSTGWTVMIGATTAITAAALPPEVAAEIYRPGVITGGTVAPKGQARATEGGYVVNGRWQFASGCRHSDWLLVTAIVFNGDSPRMAGGLPDIRQFIYPASEVEIIDTWHVAGLRGTGSHDIAVKDAWAPAERSISLLQPRRYEEGPLYSIPIFGLLSVAVCSVGLGIARRAIDEIVTLTTGKRSAFGGRLIAEAGVTQLQVARAEALVGSARAYLLEKLDAVWQTVQAGDSATLQQRAALRLAATNATAACVEAVQICYRLGGGDSVYESSPLQRCLRDMNAVTQHIATAPGTFEVAGRVLLGLDPGTPMV
jgi:indole-3-acetate monooxygenase